MRTLIAGCCAAESREQVLATARQIHALAADSLPFTLIFRAGVWKPRTSPDSFQGAGEQALEWLAEVKRETGMPVATEVAMPEHVEKALHAGLDYLWVGARTCANPIAVQILADSLKAASRKPQTVFIKNPVNSDPQLWLGNIARMEAAGVPVAAVHRGCAHRPCWQMAYAVRTARPDIPMLLDPSHMTGRRELVAQAMNRVEGLALDGAMIEVHCCPEQALSDAQQQITPAELGDIIARFQSASAGTASPLVWYRAMIDDVDDELWSLVEKRMQLAAQIGEYKKQQHIPPLQKERFETILAQRVEWSKTHHIDADAVRSVMHILHAEALRHQE